MGCLYYWLGIKIYITNITVAHMLHAPSFTFYVSPLSIPQPLTRSKNVCTDLYFVGIHITPIFCYGDMFLIMPRIICCISGQQRQHISRCISLLLFHRPPAFLGFRRVFLRFPFYFLCVAFFRSFVFLRMKSRL